MKKKQYIDSIIRILEKLFGNYIPFSIRRLLSILCFPYKYGIMLNPTYNEDGLITNHVVTFMRDEKFIESYNKSLDDSVFINHISFRWRVYVACWAAYRSINLDGDFVECGVNRGIISKAVIEYTNFTSTRKKYYLLDTFDGIPLDLATQEEWLINPVCRNNNYGDTYNFIKQRFSKYQNIIIIKGKVPETLSEIKSKEIAFISLDMNLAVPEIAAAEYLWDKLVSGGIILLDDYAYSEAYTVQMNEFNKFAKRKNVMILTLPTGQGIIIKP